MPKGVYTNLAELTRLRYDAHGFSYLPKQPVTSVLSGRKRSRLRGRGLDFDEIRHYRPGDDIRNMDWRVTRRAGSPYVRVYTEERDRPVWVLVDQTRSMFFGSKRQMKSVTAAEAAALSAWRVIGVADRVGFVLLGDEAIKVLKPTRAAGKVMQGLKQLADINQSLAAQRAGRTTTTLAGALKQLAANIGHDGLVIIISDFGGWNDQCFETLKQIRKNNDAIAVLVSDPLERNLSEAGNLVVSDGKYQLALGTRDQSARDKFAEQFTASTAALNEALLKQHIPVVPLDTATSTADQVRRLLGQRR